jgi:hypothetical protein
MHQPRLADDGTLLFLGLVWGSGFLFIGVAVKTIPPVTLILLLGEHPPWTAYLALAAILAGIAVATWRAPRAPVTAPAR